MKHGRRIKTLAALVIMFAATLMGVSTPASAAPLSCWAEPGTPYNNGQDYISIWGTYKCNKSVAWIDVSVSLEQNGNQIAYNSFHAVRLPNNGLVNAMIVYSTPCPMSGFYRIVTSGSAAGFPHSGAAGPMVFISCGPSFPV